MSFSVTEKQEEKEVETHILGVVVFQVGFGASYRRMAKAIEKEHIYIMVSAEVHFPLTSSTSVCLTDNFFMGTASRRCLI